MEIANQIDYAEEANSRLGEGATTRSQQAIVNAHFESSALQWERIYGAATLGGRIYQARMAIALQWIEQLHLPPTARLLEIGCGAGFATRSEEHTSELQSRLHLVCRLLLEKKKNNVTCVRQ